MIDTRSGKTIRFLSKTKGVSRKDDTLFFHSAEKSPLFGDLIWLAL